VRLSGAESGHALLQIERTLVRAAGVIADRQSGQSSLFGAFEDRSSPRPESVSVCPSGPSPKWLAHEKELLGFYVTAIR